MLQQCIMMQQCIMLQHSATRRTVPCCRSAGSFQHETACHRTASTVLQRGATCCKAARHVATQPFGPCLPARASWAAMLRSCGAASPGADVAQSPRRCGPVLTQMYVARSRRRWSRVPAPTCASPGAAVGKPRLRHERTPHVGGRSQATVGGRATHLTLIAGNCSESSRSSMMSSKNGSE